MQVERGNWKFCAAGNFFWLQFFLVGNFLERGVDWKFFRLKIFWAEIFSQGGRGGFKNFKNFF